METLLKQMRLRFSGFGEEPQGGSNYPRERRLPPQKTQSFKGERKSWFQRQFSERMSQDIDSNENIELATSIAAAAFAIKSLEDSGSRKEKASEKLEKVSTTKNRKDDRRISFADDPGTVSKRNSNKEIKEDSKPFTGDVWKGRSEITPDIAEPKMPKEIAAARIPSFKKTTTFGDEIAARRSPSIRKTPTFSDAYLNDTTYKKLGSKEETKPSGNNALSGGAKTQADTWEETEMEKIKIKYEKMNSTINTWETEKKTKARRRIERKEAELEKRRARALQKYRIEISKIDQVAGGAKSLADERKKSEEIKTKEKAKKIRATGELPPTCFCF